MIEVELKNGLKLSLYSSIKELPIELSKKMQLYAMQASGIGHTVADWDARMQKVTQLLETERKDEAITELKNLRLTVFSTLQGLDYRSLCFGCMVAAENGMRIDDYSEAALKARLERWNAAGLDVQDVEDVLDDVKKNLIPNE